MPFIKEKINMKLDFISKEELPSLEVFPVNFVW